MDSPFDIVSGQSWDQGLAVAVTVAVVSFYFISIDKLTTSHRLFSGGPYYDHLRYITKAESGVNISSCLSGAVTCRRTLIPIVVDFLPLDTQTSFLAITFLSFVLAGVFLFFTLNKLGFSTQMSFLGILLFYTIGPGVKFNIFDFWLMDPAAIMIITLATYAILTERNILFVIVLTVGIPIKENLILLASLFYTLQSEHIIDINQAKRTLLYTAPAIVVFGFIYLYPMLVQPSSVTHKGGGESAILYLIQNPGVPTIMVASLGLLNILPVFSIRRNLIYAARFGPYVLLVVGQFFISPFSTRRFMVFAFLPMVIFSLNGIKSLSEEINSILEQTKAYVALWAPLPAILILITPFQRQLFTDEFNKFVIPLRFVVTLLVCYILILVVVIKIYDIFKCYTLDHITTYL